MLSQNHLTNTMSVQEESVSTPPAWMTVLENKAKRTHKLAHDVGAGAACLECGDKCLGLDLHFWRKLCRNCKCTKEKHDVKEEDSFKQFDILFGESKGFDKSKEEFKKHLLNLVINKEKSRVIKARDNVAGPQDNIKKPSNGIAFDWVPPGITTELASEYMQQLPLEILPITGSSGANFRRQQLEKQIPLHDFSVDRCHDLNQEETQAFEDYLKYLKTGVVGKGCVTKLPDLQTNQANLHPGENIASDSGSNGSRSSADVKSSIKLPFANALNSSPRPFKKLYADSEGSKFKNISDPAKSSPAFITNLRTPSSFVQNELFAKPNEDDILGKLDRMNVNPQNIQPSASRFKTDDCKSNAGNNASQNAIENSFKNASVPAITLDPKSRPSYNSNIAEDDDRVVASSQLACHHCKGAFVSGGVAVVAKCLEKELEWHPQCFVCYACKELLVDLVYFFHNGEVYCGRDYAKELNIPRCFACDELIFVREYTVAEGKNFHLRHFCCFECDTPLGGQKYVPKEDHPICLPCYSRKYGKKCATCHLMIEAQDSRISWKDYDWHEKAQCFQCYQCKKCLLGSQFAVKNEKLICSKECAAKISQSH